jgi:hypothetical protein
MLSPGPGGEREMRGHALPASAGLALSILGQLKLHAIIACTLFEQSGFVLAKS